MEEDLIREKILTCLHNKHKTARSRNSQLMGIRDLARAVKGHIPASKENQVAANVSFLVLNNFAEEVAVENYYAKGKFGNTKPSYKYRLTKEGLAYFEHGSKFDSSNIFAGIGDISGDGNYVIIGNNNNISSLSNVTFLEGHKLAEDLRRKVNALGELNDEEKIAVQGDIETIKNQLGKKDPDKTILKSAKNNLGFLANIATLTPHVTKLMEWLLSNFNI